MKNLNEKIEQLLAKNFEDLSETEKEFLLKNFEIFEKMEKFQEVLLQFGELNELNPKPEIHKFLNEKVDAENETNFSILEKLKSFLNYKIPVYQPVAVLILIFAFLFFSQETSQKKIAQNPQETSFTQTAHTNPYESQTLTHLANLSEQKIGKTALEDSLLDKLIVKIY